VQQLSVEEDPEEVRIGRARAFYKQLLVDLPDVLESYDQRVAWFQRANQLRRLSPWYGMIAGRQAKRFIREHQEWKAFLADQKARKLQEQIRNKKNLEATDFGCKPMALWPQHLRTKPKPRGANWPEKARQDAPAEAGTTKPPQSG
jgi:hypothetical protein